jgi:outer membrane lipoprotein SlyB
MITVLSPTFHVWATLKVTLSAVRETASSVSTIREGHVAPISRVRLPSVRSSQPLGADEGPADGTRLGMLVGPADGWAEGATVGPVEGALLGPADGPAVGPPHPQAKAMVY